MNTGTTMQNNYTYLILLNPNTNYFRRTFIYLTNITKITHAGNIIAYFLRTKYEQHMHYLLQKKVIINYILNQTASMHLLNCLHGQRT